MFTCPSVQSSGIRVKVISILNSKGGVGKSTLACQLARAFHLLPARVLLIDTDTDQRSSYSWGEIQEAEIGLPVIVTGANLERDLKAVGGSFDYIFIDGAAKLEKVDVQAIRVSDLVVVPLQPSLFDVWPVRRLVGVIGDRRELMNGRPDVAFVATNHNPRVKESSELREVLSEYEDMPLLDAGMPDRVIYSRSLDAGLSIFDWKGEEPSEARAATVAAREVTAIRDELIRRFAL